MKIYLASLKVYLSVVLKAAMMVLLLAEKKDLLEWMSALQMAGSLAVMSGLWMVDNLVAAWD